MSSGERAPLPTHGIGQVSRTRSYGSLVQSSVSPVLSMQIEHHVQPGETLQGLSLKYGVSMEEIKRANRLYTNDSIFLKKYLSIHVPTVSNTLNGLDDSAHANITGNSIHNGTLVSSNHGNSIQNGTLVNSNHGNSIQNGTLVSNNHEKQLDSSSEGTSDSELSPMDFLKRMDSVISLSKEAAVKTCQQGEKSFAYLEAACANGTPGHRLTRSHSASPAPRMHQQATLGVVPLTIITKHSKKLSEREDDIFEL